MEVDNTISRERYEKLVSQMRENMQGAIDARKKYALEAESQETEVSSDESGETATEGSGDSTG